VQRTAEPIENIVTVGGGQTGVAKLSARFGHRSVLSG
jgi:hypothetical protein